MKITKQRIVLYILSIAISVFLILIGMSIQRQSPKPFTIAEHKAYYLTVDSDGKVWIGDRYGQKQAPLYNAEGHQVRTKK